MPVEADMPTFDVAIKRINEIIKLVGLENRIDDKVGKYSLGMRQRLGIAEALLHNPNLLVLDEPTNGLDPEGMRMLKDILRNLAIKLTIFGFTIPTLVRCGFIGIITIISSITSAIISINMFYKTRKLNNKFKVWKNIRNENFDLQIISV